MNYKQSRFFQTTIYAVGAGIAAFILNLYVVNSVTPQVYSQIFMTLLNAKLLSLLLNFSTNQLILKFPNHYRFVTTYTFVFGLILCTCLFLLKATFDSIFYNMVSVGIAFMIAMQANQQSLLLVKNELRAFNFLILALPTIICFLTLLLFEFFEVSYYSRFTAHLTSYMLILFVSFTFITKNYPGKSCDDEAKSDISTRFLAKNLPVSLVISILIFSLQNADKYIFSTAVDEKHLLLFAYSLSMPIAVLMQSFFKVSVGGIYKNEFEISLRYVLLGYAGIVCASVLSFSIFPIFIDIGVINSEYLASRNYFFFVYSVIYISHISSLIINVLNAKGLLSVFGPFGVSVSVFLVVILLIWALDMPMVIYLIFLSAYSYALYSHLLKKYTDPKD